MARYREVRVPISHPLARTTRATADGAEGYIWEHRAVLYEKIGPGQHPCHWCERLVIWRVGRIGGDTLVVDHLDGNPQNNDPANLVPSCHRCNCTRTLGLVQDDELFIEYPSGKRVRATSATCRGCGTTFLVPNYRADRNYQGIYCSRRCMGEARRTH